MRNRHFHLHKIIVDETLLQADEKRERSCELKLRILKRAFYGLEDVLDAFAIVFQRLLHPVVEERAGYEETEYRQAEPDADEHRRRV